MGLETGSAGSPADATDATDPADNGVEASAVIAAIDDAVSPIVELMDRIDPKPDVIVTDAWGVEHELSTKVKAFREWRALRVLRGVPSLKAITRVLAANEQVDIIVEVVNAAMDDEVANTLCRTFQRAWPDVYAAIVQKVEDHADEFVDDDDDEPMPALLKGASIWEVAGAIIPFYVRWLVQGGRKTVALVV